MFISVGLSCESVNKVHVQMSLCNLLFVLQVAVYLIDCQGTGDTKQNNSQLDTLIFYISLQISSAQLVNLRGLMEARDITSLQVCLHIGKKIRNTSKSKCFAMRHEQ